MVEKLRMEKWILDHLAEFKTNQNAAKLFKIYEWGKVGRQRLKNELLRLLAQFLDQKTTLLRVAWFVGTAQNQKYRHKNSRESYSGRVALYKSWLYEKCTKCENYDTHETALNNQFRVGR